MRARVEAGAPLAGRLTYVEADYGFRFDVVSPADLVERAGGPQSAAALIGTLQIEVGVASRRALFVWGLHPRSRWRDGSLPAPVPTGGAVVLGPEVDYPPGAAVAIADVGDWDTTYDPASGWVRVAAGPGPEQQLVEIADAVLLGTVGGDLVSVWLRPELQ